MSLRVFWWNVVFAVTVVAVASHPGASFAQYLENNTVVSAPDSLVLGGKSPDYVAGIHFAKIKVFVHLIQDDNGSGGLSQSEVDSMLTVAGGHLFDLDIYVELLGQDVIKNSTYYSDPDAYYSNLFQENPHTDAIDIYLGPSQGPAKGRASGIPGGALVLSGQLDSYSALSQLLGNCLGLYSTDETLFGTESHDGSNGHNAGDFIVDTPADPGLEGYVDTNCNLTQAFQSSYPNHSPSVGNIMSNSRLECVNHFSQDQRNRVLAAVEYYQVLKDVVTSVPASSYSDYTDGTKLMDYYTTVPALLEQ